jgi:myo-inositol-1(or 4)-monophosphatase
LIEFAHLAADRSGADILPFFRRPIRVENKASGGAFDPVTAADRKAERTIAALVAEHWPDHGMIGEEHGGFRTDAHYRWLIDPIDGTRAFIMGAPTWGTLIGLLDGPEPLLGVMDQPFTGERFWSGPRSSYARVRGGKARQIRTRACPRLAEATLTTTHPDLLSPGLEAEAFARLKAKARMTRYGGDCYAYCLLASGFVDLVVETGINAFDIVALIPIIERAGGRITTWNGHSAASGGRIVAAGDPKLHAEALRVLNG